MDLLSDILSLLRPRTVETYGLSTGGDWALDFPRPYEGIKFGAVTRGSCWLSDRIAPAPIRLDPGDCYLLSGQPYWLGSAPERPGDNSAGLFLDPVTRVVQHGDQHDTFLVGGRITFDESHEVLLTGALPPVMHIPAASEEAGILRWTLDRLALELTQPRPGAAQAAEHLGLLVFIAVLRVHIARQGHGTAGWLQGLNDPRIGRSLRLMHAAPATRWTLQALAAEAGMSRTAFALRFRTLVGRPPLDYLLRWRMRLAGSALATTTAPLPEVARAVGYESESAFSNAFKRVLGVAPIRYRLKQKANAA